MTAERKLLLLGLLRQTDMHGYVLNAHLEGMSPVTLKRPTAYNLLDRMEQDGWIEYRSESTGDRHRKVYSVTEVGEKAFFELLREQLRKFIPNEAPSLVSLSFLDALPALEVLGLLRKRCKSLITFRSSLVPAGDSHPDDPHTGSMQLALEYARRLADLDLAFINEIIEGLEGAEFESAGGHK